MATEPEAIEVTISVHERKDGLGFLVRMVEPCPGGRVARFPVSSLDEGEKLDASIAKNVDIGCDINSLVTSGDVP